MGFVNLEKVFNRVPRKELKWAFNVVGVPEWLVKLVQAMYVDAKCRTLLVRDLKSKLGCTRDQY